MVTASRQQRNEGGLTTLPTASKNILRRYNIMGKIWFKTRKCVCGKMLSFNMYEADHRAMARKFTRKHEYCKEA